MENPKARGPIVFALGEGEDTAAEILDFQILAEIPLD